MVFFAGTTGLHNNSGLNPYDAASDDNYHQKLLRVGFRIWLCCTVGKSPLYLTFIALCISPNCLLVF